MRREQMKEDTAEGTWDKTRGEGVFMALKT